MTRLRLHSAKLVVKSSTRELCMGKRKIGNSWYLIVVKDNYDRWEVWHVWQPRSFTIFVHKHQAGYRPTLLKQLATNVTNHVRHAWLSTVVSTNKASCHRCTFSSDKMSLINFSTQVPSTIHVFNLSLCCSLSDLEWELNSEKALC